MPRANTLKRAAASSGAGSTVERILDGALALLNRDGGSDTTTNHIAAHLGMSPGNLYYHFRNREQIVRALFVRVAAEGLAATAPPASAVLTAAEFGARHLEGLRILWRYRFFFRDLNQLVARDRELAAEFERYERRLRGQYRALFERLLAQGDMRPLRPADDLDRVVANAVVIWFNWLPYVRALRPRPEITRADVVEGALHSFLVAAPLLEPGFASAARAVIERHRRGAGRAKRGDAT